jgi:peroxiredoxin
MKKILIYSAFALIAAAAGVFFGIQNTAPAQAETSAVAQLFSQNLVDATGQPQAMAQWKNKALVVNFWATWCPPCVDEMPELSALQKEIQSKNIQIIGIGIDSPSNIAQFATKHKISYPLYAGGMSGTELSRQFGNQAGGLPFTVLIDRHGAVKKSYLGRLRMEELRKDLLEL